MVKPVQAHPPAEAVAWTVLAFLAAALPHLLAMPGWLMLVILVLAIWRVGAAWQNWQPPPAWLRLGITLALLGLVVIFYGGLWGRRAATGLLCMMLAAKMMEMFRLRDLRLVASMCFFLIATQFLFSERLVYLAYLAGAFWVATAALLLIQRVDSAQPKPASASWTRSTLRPVTLLIVAAVPLALALFVTFPRLAQPLWGLPDEVMDGRTGLSDSMSPGSIANLYADESAAFRVEFDGPMPPPAERYWRGPVFWNFDGHTWSRSFFSTSPATVMPEAGTRSWDYRVQLEPHEQRWLFSLDYPVEYPRGARVTADYQMISRRAITTLTQYEVSSNPDFIDTPDLPQTLHNLATRLPDDRNPRTLALAAEWRERYPDDQQLIDAILRWFNEEAFFYSLETSPMGRNSVDEFLFDLRTGYCEHYASAFAVMMRAAGVPARIVTGYQGGWWSTTARYLLVRQSDAHAWVEVWLPEQGWTRVDPTAAVSPSRIREGSRVAIDQPRHLLDWDWVQDLRNRYDRVQHLWNNWVLGFDASRQRQFLGGLGLGEPGLMMIGLTMVLSAMLVVGLVALLLLRRPRARPRSQAERLWQQLLARLRRRGLACSPTETPLEFSQRVSHALPNQSGEFDRLTWLYCRLHYGTGQHQDLLPEFTRRVEAFKP